MPPNVKKHTYPRFFVSADWSKEPGKRAVYIADLRERRIFRQARSNWSFDGLMALAEGLSAEGRVVVGVDVALGVPRSYWKLVLADSRYGHPTNFVDWLGRLGGDRDFFNPANTARNHEQWRVDLPWFHVPKGKGTLTAFKQRVDDGFLRLIDRSTGAKPLFAVSGIPGAVGSGTRDFWRELAPNLRTNRKFAVWPFEGPLALLLEHHRVVLAETYPGLAYAAALARELPTQPMRVVKTGKKHQRIHACEKLVDAAWVNTHGVNLGDLTRPGGNEDDFDALMTAAAVLRCCLEGIRVARHEWIDWGAEGSMLLAGPVDPTRNSRGIAKSKRQPGQPRLELRTVTADKEETSPPKPRQLTSQGKAERPCPIPGCPKVFHGSRGGWDAHVEHLRIHPTWHPDISDRRERKALFKKEYPSWFR